MLETACKYVQSWKTITYVKRYPTKLQNQLSNIHDQHIYVQTLTNRFKEYQLTPKVEAKNFLLTRTTIKTFQLYVNQFLEERGILKMCR